MLLRTSKTDYDGFYNKVLLRIQYLHLYFAGRGLGVLFLNIMFDDL